MSILHREKAWFRLRLIRRRRHPLTRKFRIHKIWPTDWRHALVQLKTNNLLMQTGYLLPVFVCECVCPKELSARDITLPVYFVWKWNTNCVATNESTIFFFHHRACYSWVGMWFRSTKTSSFSWVYLTWRVVLTASCEHSIVILASLRW